MAFLDAAKAWETDQIVRVQRSERRAWIFASLGMATALAAVIALALLTPLKTVEPFVVRVDKNTGATDIVTRLTDQKETYNEAIDKYFLSRYVIYRNSYSNAMAYPDYEAVTIMSSAQVADSYFEQIKPNNPHSPTAVYGKDGQVDVSVNAIAFLGKGVAQVRFTRTEYLPNAQGQTTRWIATITYRYLNPPTTERARLVDPIGFQVSDYRFDPETAPTGG
ncbi:MAG TPA: type IV secretion system protein [Rhodanobacteraceae bacterium]|nr:type IV secretion system protein [Rhodanobacteraceae bacterium]